MSRLPQDEQLPSIFNDFSSSQFDLIEPHHCGYGKCGDGESDIKQPLQTAQKICLTNLKQQIEAI